MCLIGKVTKDIGMLFLTGLLVLSKPLSVYLRLAYQAYFQAHSVDEEKRGQEKTYEFYKKGQTCVLHVKTVALT